MSNPPGYIWITTSRLTFPLPAYTHIGVDDRIRVAVSIWLVLIVVRRWLRRALSFMAALASTILWNAIWDMALALHQNRAAHVDNTLSPLVNSGYWLGVQDGDPRAFALYQRHYSYRTYKSGRTNRLIAGPGEKMVLMTYQCDALFVWRKFDDMRHEPGVNCAVFRNESPIRASDLIREAMILAWARWPGERLYTYVNAKKISSSNPGYCFKMAGWHKCGETKGGLAILEALPAGYVAREPEPRGVIIGRLEDLKPRQLELWEAA